MNTEMIFALLGIIGAACPVTMYFLLEQEKVDPKSYLFFGVNGLGSVLIILASVGEFDWGDIGAVAMEAAWLLISLLGMFKIFRTSKQTKGENV